MSADPAPLPPGAHSVRPRPARARLHVELPEYVPARMLNEFVYCPRLFFYEWVDGVFAHNADTVGGSLRHDALDARTDALPAPETIEGQALRARGITLSSDTHGLIAKMDLVDVSAGAVAPVDYKFGRPRDTDDGPEAWPADRVQLCAQALVLRDNGYDCREAVAYYHATKQRVRIAVDDGLIAETLEALRDARALASSGRIPPPLEDSPKCPRCSLVGICLPDETLAAIRWRDDEAADQLPLFEPSEAPAPGPLAQPPGEQRRLVPARDDLRPLYVTGFGLTVGKSGGVLQVREKKELLQEARLNDVSQLNVFGAVQVTAGVVEAMCQSEKPIAHFSSGGWFYGVTQGLGLRNAYLRRAQFARAEDPSFCAKVAASLVASKIRNQRTLLQRNHVEPPERALLRLKTLSASAARCQELDSLLGIEGTAARVYFEQFNGMIKVEGQGADDFAFDLDGRNRRPPRDPVNAMLSLAYAFLVRDLTIICHAVGFDPFAGYFHQMRFGRPALALDLIEEFRPLVADSCVITAINTRMVTPDDFVRAGGAVALSQRGRTGLIRAYEQRMDTLVTHPMFGYRVSYRRVMEIQARLLARVVEGETPRYIGFETR